MTSNSAPVSNTKFRIPNGFNLILEGLTREVLRYQPENINEFALQYFKDMIRRREGKVYCLNLSFLFHL